MSKIFIPIMAVAFGLLLFSIINSNSDYCITCGLWDNDSTTKTNVNPELKECQFGFVRLSPVSDDYRCMYEDEFYNIDSYNNAPALVQSLDDIEQQITLTNRMPETCVFVNNQWWCTNP